MARIKLGIKVLGLCALVFALMGIASSGAQAEPTSLWLVLEGATIVEKGELKLETDKTFIVHSKVAGTKILFTCTTIATVGANLEAGGKIAKKSKIKFSGCSTELNEKASATCIPISGGTEKGVIVTKEAHALLVLHKLEPSGTKDELIEVLPDEVGGPFAVIEMGKECSIGTKVPIIGKLFLKDCQNEFLVHKEIHLLEEGPLTNAFVISETEEHRASASGSAFERVVVGGVVRSFAGHAG